MKRRLNLATTDVDSCTCRARSKRFQAPQTSTNGRAKARLLQIQVLATGKKKDAASRCERICSLKDASCEVSERICGLAHEDDPKYAEACTRSEERCEHATTACSSCTPN